MENLKLPVHSVIDVITNSSTEIFTYADDNSIKLCHEAINEILKISGSNKKSEDLFDIVIDEEPDSSREFEDRNESTIIITAKDSSISTKDIFSLFFNSIEQDAEYNG